MGGGGVAELLSLMLSITGFPWRQGHRRVKYCIVVSRDCSHAYETRHAIATRQHNLGTET